MQLHGFQQRQLFAEVEWFNCMLLHYSHAQLLKMTSARLTPDLFPTFAPCKSALIYQESNLGEGEKKTKTIQPEWAPQTLVPLIDWTINQQWSRLICRESTWNSCLHYWWHPLCYNCSPIWHEFQQSDLLNYTRQLCIHEPFSKFYQVTVF